MFDKQYLRDILLISIMAFLTVAGVTFVTQQVKHDMEQYQKESLCIQEKIRQGYARNQIQTGNGTCTIKSRI